MPAAKTRTPAKKTSTPRKAAPARSAAKKVAAATPDGKAAVVAAPAPDKHAKSDGHGKAGKGKTRPALVRDGFTMPAADFALIATLKARALSAHREAKKSELLRAGLRALAELDGAALLAALNRLEPVKTGRPKKAH